MITEDSFIDSKCPHCGDAVSFPQEYAGQVQACPICSEDLIVTSQGAETGQTVPIPIETPRLFLRRLHATDWKDLLELMSDEELFTYSDVQPMEEEQVLQWLEHDAHVKLSTAGQAFYLGIALREPARLIGFLALRLLDPHRLQASVSVYVNRAFQRKGLASEALGAVLDFCFDAIHLHRVSAACESRNVAGCKLLEKTGLRCEGEFVKDKLAGDEWVNTTSYAILEEEHRKAK
jgi:RimJ/RimL family protein N-acetyltransferase